jgi:uncharacterized protein YndB with AHSA1/START domain
MHDSVTVHIDASPADVWELVSDVTRIGEYSPETFEAEWLDGATGPEVGARFRGHVKRNGRGPTYWAPCVVTACETERVFEFGVGRPGHAINTWRHELAAADGGTDVTESFRLADNLFSKVWRPLGGFLRENRNRRDMLRTLERVKAAAEAA